MMVYDIKGVFFYHRQHFPQHGEVTRYLRIADTKGLHASF